MQQAAGQEPQRRSYKEGRREDSTHGSGSDTGSCRDKTKDQDHKYAGDKGRTLQCSEQGHIPVAPYGRMHDAEQPHGKRTPKKRHGKPFQKSEAAQQTMIGGTKPAE